MNNYFSTVYPIKKILEKNGCKDCKVGYTGQRAFIVKCEKCKNYEKGNKLKKKNGRVEVSSGQELNIFPIGSIVSYINNKDEFRTGGYITKITADYFIYVTPDFKTKYRVRHKNVKKMWVGDVYKVSNDIVSISKTTQPKTDFPVKIGNITVHYASDITKKKNFMKTKKYKTSLEWYNYFYKN